MNDLNWKYGKNSLIGVELESYNTLYVDKASFHNNGLILQQKDKVIGFISLDKILGILQKTFVSKTGILLTNSSFNHDELICLEEFVCSERIVIISQVDFVYNQMSSITRITNFLGNKQTIINLFENDADSWLLKIKKKHRYYVRRALKENNQKCEIKFIETLDPSFISKIYDLYSKYMGIKGVNLLFETKNEFMGFIERNPKSIIITLCLNDNEISYFNIVHTNNKVANYIIAVTTQYGMKSYASYMGVFMLYDHLYRNNFKILNFGGVDSNKNHGVYLFKRGFSGKFLDSPSYMVIGIGLVSRIAKTILKLRIFLKSR